MSAQYLNAVNAVHVLSALYERWFVAATIDKCFLRALGAIILSLVSVHLIGETFDIAKCLDCLWRSLKMDGTGRRKNVILQDSLFFPWFHLGQADWSALYSESFDVNLCYVQAPRFKKLHRFTVKVSAITKPSTNKSHLLTDTNIWLQWHFYHKLHYIKLHFLATILDDLRWIS